MIINDVHFNAELIDILKAFKDYLTINDVHLLGQIKELPDDIMVSCPYHKGGQEKRPSAGFRKNDGTFHCLACNETHTLPEVLSFCMGNTKDYIGNTGWQWLLQHYALASVENRKKVELNFSRGRATSKNEFVSEEELDSYRYIHPYMYKRKLTDDVIELFDIGYDKKTQCITFPVRDKKGNTLFIARRSVNSKYFNYPCGAEKPLYGLYELSTINDPKEVIVCESMLDALAFWAVGKPAVALNGLGTELQFNQLKKLPCRLLILCTDMDKAGMQAREKIRKAVNNKLIAEYMLPEGRKDANDCTPEELQALEKVFWKNRK